MGYFSELAAELQEEREARDRANAELQIEITCALRRVVTGTATRDDARVLAYASGVSLSDIGLASKPVNPYLSIDFDSKVF
jgi:hypothetical protein